MTLNKKEVFLDAMNVAAGNVSIACKKARIARETFYRWKRDDPEFANKVFELEESLLDMAETMLLKNIKEGRTAEIIFFLKTKGKKRGYIERSEVDLSNNQHDFKGLSTEELLELVKNPGQ